MSPPEEPPMSRHESKVLELITSYRNVDERHPLVDLLCNNPESNEFFHETLNHDAFIISKRSQDIEDGEISIYQKAFLILSDNQPQDYNAAVALWTDELFGFRAMPNEMEAVDILANLTAKVHAVHHMRNLMKAHAPEDEDCALENTAESPTMILSHEKDCRNQLHESPTDISQGFLPDTKAKTATPKPFANDANFQHLLETYHKARRDFDDAMPRTKERTAAARFLRDTSENCLGYLTRKKCESFIEALTQSSVEEIIMDKAVVRELTDTVAETSAFVESSRGGKKRSFDEGTSTDHSTASMTTQSKPTSPKRKRRPRIKLIVEDTSTARTPIRADHMARQQAPSPENLRLGRHEVTMPPDRPTDNHSPEDHVRSHRWESHHAIQRGEIETGERFRDARDCHGHRFDTTSRHAFARGRPECSISPSRYPSYDFRHDYEEDCFERDSEYHKRDSGYRKMASGRSAPRAWDTYHPVYDY